MGRLGGLFGRFRPQRRYEEADAAARGKAGWVVAGLGNPGDRYQRSRHNVGFRVIDSIAAARGTRLTRRKFKGLYVETKLDSEPVILLKPQTYYNQSGESVASLLGYFKVPVERLVVVHDDMDLSAGQLRIKRGGGDAGNRGVRSIAETLSDAEFIRVRVGIGHPAANSEDARDYVLKVMKQAELAEFAPVVARAAEAVCAIVLESLERAMNRYNQRV